MSALVDRHSPVLRPRADDSCCILPNRAARQTRRAAPGSMPCRPPGWCRCAQRPTWRPRYRRSGAVRLIQGNASAQPGAKQQGVHIMSTSATLIFRGCLVDPNCAPQSGDRPPTSTWRLTRATAARPVWVRVAVGASRRKPATAPEQGRPGLRARGRFQVAVWARKTRPRRAVEVTARRVSSSSLSAGGCRHRRRGYALLARTTSPYHRTARAACRFCVSAGRALQSG